jgi:hypothetical protein
VVDLGAFEFNPAAPPGSCVFITCPADVELAAPPGQTSTVVDYPPPTASTGATVECSPPSGSVFPAGETAVTCTARDPSGATASCGFTVTVTLTPIPLVIDVSIDQTGTVDLVSGLAMVHGTVACSKPTLVTLSGQVQEAFGRFSVVGSFTTQASCVGTSEWTVVVSATGRFTPGNATVEALGQAFDFETGQLAWDLSSARVVLKGVRFGSPPVGDRSPGIVSPSSSGPVLPRRMN